MAKSKTYTEEQLAALAKSFREAAGKNRAEAAREIGVSRPVVFDAEEDPAKSLTKVRIRIIEKYSAFKVTGPVFRLEKR